MFNHLHFDCFSGVAGDMTLAALIDLGVPVDLVRGTLDSLGLPGKLEIEKTKRKSIAATRVIVHAEVENKHRHLHHIDKIIDAGQMTDSAKVLSKRIFRTLAQAEAEVHGSTIEKVHFHEVGAVDSIFDIVGVAVALDHLQPVKITAAPVPTGSGWVDCEHGRMPVPAPATARLLIGVPTAPSDISTELTTPTGAAILKTIVGAFTKSLPSRFERIGCGAGTKDFPSQPNILRAFWASGTEAVLESDLDAVSDVICQVETDVDDVPGEQIGYAVECLWAAGALDVHLASIQMKKQRPGITITALCRPEATVAIETVLFRETGTFGIRRQTLTRSKLRRMVVEAATPFGLVRGKFGWNDFVKRVTPEYEDCARLARERQVPFADVFRAAQQALAAAVSVTP